MEGVSELRRGVTRLARRLRAERSPDALSANKVSVLSQLHHHGPSSPGELAASERQQPQSLTRVFADLEREGLISRSRSDLDGRQAVIALTESGRTALAADMAERDAWLSSALAGFNQTEREVLRLAGSLLDRLADAAPATERKPPMGWSEHAIWWQVYPLGFLGAEREALPAGAEPNHRLPRLAAWFDYLVELGANGLALGPVFASETHGYDTTDHLRIDPRLGDESDLVRLVEQANARGVRVLLDGVFNHVGRGFAAPDPAWFRRDGNGELATFEGHDRLVALDHTEPAVADYVVEVMTYWLERGVAGWRLDVAYQVPLPFWRAVTDRVRARFPDAWFVGEVIHGDYAAFAKQGGLDSVTQYELWKAIWSSLNDRNFFELAWALDRHNEWLESLVPQTFVGNHDVTRLASRLADQRALEHALVVLTTVGGIPSIYAGDEQAFRGVKEDREGGDDAIRPAFPDRPQDLAPDGLPYYRLHQDLIGLRRRLPWLVEARTTVAELSNTAIAYVSSSGEPGGRPRARSRRPAGGARADGGETEHGRPQNEHRLVVALNVADEPAELPLPEGYWLRAAGKGEVDNGRAVLPAYGWLIATA